MTMHRQIGECFAHAATGFALTDVKGNVIHANETLARIIDLSLSEIRNTNLFDLTHPEDQVRHYKLLDQLLHGEIRGFVIEKRYVRRNGDPIWVRNSVSLVDDDEKEAEAPHLISISEDIHQRKCAERILEQQEQMAAIGRLTSSIVHEINNPLEAVLNLLFLARHAADLSSTQRYVKDAEEELGRVCEITMHGLQFHRQPSIPVSTNVVELLESVLALFKGKFRMAGVGLELKVDDGPELMCFAGEMRQVFVNLIANAIESMPEGGRLTVRLRPGTDWRSNDPGVRITIADTGYGMSPETRDRMYDAFYTTKGPGGSGLGLWVTANIVRKHQGCIHVRSKRLVREGGTAFTLIFPHSGAAGRAAGFQDLVA
ncbi:MAG TPA: ATP-binding protein [Acidobacteriaceae bacterium]|nr:ATP-binding protein [Acidobacteriaceae bacterium]